jgi:hypothetical protein
MKSSRDGVPASFARDHAARIARVQQPGDLSVGEQFVLWALRQWQCELSAWERDGAFPAGESGLHEGFRMAGLLEALPEFAMAMDVILFGIGRVLEIHCPSCRAMSHDEAVLMALCGLAQAELDGPLAASLNAMLGPEAAEVAGARLTAFATMLGAAGLGLASTQDDTGTRLH